MPTISTKQRQQDQNVILNFTIVSANFDEEVFITEPININDVALVRLKFQHKSNNPTTLESNISLKKINKPKSSSSIVKIRVICEKLDKEWYCTDEWDEKSLLSKSREHFVNDIIISMLEVKLTAYQPQTSTPQTQTSPPQTQKLYDDEELTDFQLTAADGNVAIHKALLAMHSDVFMMMFKREWKETLEGEIAIKGVARQTLQDLKQYIYLGTLPNEGLEPLLMIADRYMMDELKADCIAKMVQNVTPEKLDDIVEFSCLNNVPDLMRAVLFETPESVVTKLYELKMSKKEGEDENN